MIFYHFTAESRLPVIMREGLSKGEVPLSEKEVLNAVWLTTSQSPTGHGLRAGGELTAQEKATLYAMSPTFDPDQRVFHANKQAIRIAIKIPSSDRALIHWPRWARKRISDEWLGRLHAAGGHAYKTWYLYWGVIPPTAFLSVENLSEQSAKVCA